MMDRIIRLLFLLFITFPLFSCGEPELILDGSYSVFGKTEIAAGMSFPPFSNLEQIAFTVDEVKKLAIDRIRIAVDWRYREPSQGSYNWAPMDLRINTAKENNISIFLTIISLGPDWATLSPGSDGACMLNENALLTFIEELLVRYNNILFDAVQRLSPHTEVVLGGLTRTYPIVEYFAKNGNYPDFSGIKLANGATVEYLKNQL